MRAWGEVPILTTGEKAYISTLSTLCPVTLHIIQYTV